MDFYESIRALLVELEKDIKKYPAHSNEYVTLGTALLVLRVKLNDAANTAKRVNAHKSKLNN